MLNGVADDHGLARRPPRRARGRVRGAHRRASDAKERAQSLAWRRGRGVCRVPARSMS